MWFGSLSAAWPRPRSLPWSRAVSLASRRLQPSGSTMPVPGGTQNLETAVGRRSNSSPPTGLALYDVDGEAATRGLLIFVQHVAPGDAHRVDGFVQGDEVAPVSAQGDAGRVDRGDGSHRVPLDARHLDQAADRVAGQPEVVLDADLRGVFHL